MAAAGKDGHFGEAGWWEDGGSYSLLRAINPTRLAYVQGRACGLEGRRVADVGCGGGIFSEELARCGAKVTGVDPSKGAIETAKKHAKNSKLEIEYQTASCESFAQKSAGDFEVITCMEMLEHVADPKEAIAHLGGLLRRDGDLIISTINRNPASYAAMITFGENMLGMLPRGTHDYAMFITPSQASGWCDEAGLQVLDIAGLNWSFFGKRFTLSSMFMPVNYFLHARKL